MKTPYFLIQENILKNNIEVFNNGMRLNWEHSLLGYSVKTNSLPWLLKYVKQHGGVAEVVSDEEYDIALRCGFDATEIIFNGPIKGKKHFLSAISMGSYVNIDSENELKWLEEYNKPVPRLGIRVNVPPEVFQNKDIEYNEDGFRFGFSVENGAFENALQRLSATQDVNHIGIHLHCNSITRAKEVYRAIARYAVDLIEKYNIEPQYIDIGGGFFGGVPGKTTIQEYFLIIANELKRTDRTKNSLLIAEPGSAIIGSAIELHTSVIDVKDTNHIRVVTTDGGRILIDPQWFRTHYMYSVNAAGKRCYEGRQIICGYTCMDHDRIMEVKNGVELQVGDEIIYYRVGAYTVTFGGPFIRFFPEVYVTTGEKTIKIRNRLSVNEYYKFQSIEGDK